MKHEYIKLHIKNYYKNIFEGKSNCYLNTLKGKELALSLGYSLELIDYISHKDWYAFLACGNPLPFMKPSSGDYILNLGSGIGIDSLLIYNKFNLSITIFNMDLNYVALKRSKELISHTSEDITSFHWICADGCELPFRTCSFDGIIMNGVFNLFPNKESLLREINRVLKLKGILIVTDLSCREKLEEYFYEELDAWAWCMSGAYTEKNLINLLQLFGFNEIYLDRDDIDNTFYRITFSCQKEEDIRKHTQ